jgi:hypothetical protein
MVRTCCTDLGDVVPAGKSLPAQRTKAILDIDFLLPFIGQQVMLRDAMVVVVVVVVVVWCVRVPIDHPRGQPMETLHRP